MMSYYEPEDVPECASCEQAQKDYAELEREVEQWKKAAEANIEENVRLRREAHTWSKACEAATTKLHKLSTPHPRLEVRYWTGEYWEPLHGALFYAALDALFTVPTTEIQEAEQIYAEELLQAHTRDLERLDLMKLRESEQEGWKEAAIAWEVCASIHEKWAKRKDALYSTRHADFEKHAADARQKLTLNA